MNCMHPTHFSVLLTFIRNAQTQMNESPFTSVHKDMNVYCLQKRSYYYANFVPMSNFLKLFGTNSLKKKNVEHVLYP